MKKSQLMTLNQRSSQVEDNSNVHLANFNPVERRIQVITNSNFNSRDTTMGGSLVGNIPRKNPKVSGLHHL